MCFQYLSVLHCGKVLLEKETFLTNRRLEISVFTSSFDSHFLSFLFIFKLSGLILWNTDAKMVGCVPCIRVSP